MDYKKKLEESKFIKFREYSSLNFAVGASLFIGVIILLFSVDFAKKSFNVYTIAVSLLYFLSSLVSYLVLIKLKKDVKNNNDISVLTRRLGFILIFFLVFANIFTASSGFLLIAKKKKLEYIFIFEAFLINISIIFVSGVNLFKEIIWLGDL